MVWIVVATVIIAIGFILYYQRQYENEKKKSRTEIHKVANYFKCKLLEESLHRCLTQMDKTNGFYNEEDEANRELTSCLSLLGHDAKYHYRLDNKRTADILVDNCIIEGKLDPSPAEADRLIGQITDYLSLPNRIFVVLYGFVDKSLLDRLQKQVFTPNPARVNLVYLNNARRVRVRNY